MFSTRVFGVCGFELYGSGVLRFGFKGLGSLENSSFRWGVGVRPFPRSECQVQRERCSDLQITALQPNPKQSNPAQKNGLRPNLMEFSF